MIGQYSFIYYHNSRHDHIRKAFSNPFNILRLLSMHWGIPARQAFLYNSLRLLLLLLARHPRPSRFIIVSSQCFSSCFLLLSLPRSHTHTHSLSPKTLLGTNRVQGYAHFGNTVNIGESASVAVATYRPIRRACWVAVRIDHPVEYLSFMSWERWPAVEWVYPRRGALLVWLACAWLTWLSNSLRIVLYDCRPISHTTVTLYITAFHEDDTAPVCSTWANRWLIRIGLKRPSVNGNC